MESLPSNIEELVKRSPLKGIQCTFVRVSDEWGIKAYLKDECSRDESYYYQSLYASRGWGPPVGEKFQIGEYFCYSTRVAEVLIDPNAFLSDEWDDTQEAWRDRISKQVEAMHLDGLEPKDYHIGNWGIYEGKLVLIDFGMCS